MDVNNVEWKLEEKWLQHVLKEAQKQYDEKRDTKEKFKREAIETQRELWQEVGSVSISNGLDQITDFIQFINMMKIEKRSHEFVKKLEEKYEKILLTPYFGRIDFIENRDNSEEKYYIGIGNLIDDNYNILIYDWRAPISSMFYDYEIGKASYECPEGIIDGRITLKRQYKIENGKMQYMFDSNLKIDDEVLQDMLSKNTDSKMKTIVTTIQREQNKVIRNECYKNLIVQGPAGSGKTSVALHRIAYLLYKHRDKIKPQNIVIFSPNDIFNDYISSVLPQLGEDNMCQTTFKEYMHAALGSGFIKESYCDMMEYILISKGKASYRTRINSIKFKSSKKFANALKEYVHYLENEERCYTDISLKDILIISSKDIHELFFDTYKELPLKRRLQKIRERILFLLKPYERQRIDELNNDIGNKDSKLEKAEIIKRSISIVREETSKVYQEINRITEFNLIDIYRRLFVNFELFNLSGNDKYDRREVDKIKKYTFEDLRGGVLKYEDQLALLYLKSSLGDLPKTSDIMYVIIDEAQDYTPLQYEIFHNIFESASFTILGDLQQSINPFMNVGNYENILDIYSEDNTCLINLTKSYRSTMEITRFSRRLLNKEIASEYVERSGEEPKTIRFKDEEDIKKRLLEDIKLYKEMGLKSIGIITRTAKEAKDVYGFLNDKVSVKVITKDDDEYTSDTLVIPSYLSKGLEFDAVFIYNAGDGNYSCEEERLLLYTACTRALHVLNIYYTGKLVLLNEEDSDVKKD